MDDVVSELRLHQVAGLSFGKFERGLFEFRDHLSALDPTQRSALRSTAGAWTLGSICVLRVFLCQFGEVCSGLKLFQQSLRSRLSRRFEFWVRFVIRPDRLDE